MNLQRNVVVLLQNVLCGQTLYYNGDSAAQILLMANGGLNPEVNAKISNEIAKLLKEYFNINSDRYVIEFYSLNGCDIGCNNGTA